VVAAQLSFVPAKLSCVGRFGRVEPIDTESFHARFNLFRDIFPAARCVLLICFLSTTNTPQLAAGIFYFTYYWLRVSLTPQIRARGAEMADFFGYRLNGPKDVLSHHRHADCEQPTRMPSANWKSMDR
jgi:hypothetical protein